MIRRTIQLAILVTLVCALVGQARVYWRWQGGARVDATMTTLGGTSVYQSDATVNQVAGHLSVYGFEEAIKDVTARLGRELELGDWYNGGQMSMSSVQDGGDTTRVLALTVAPERTVVLTFQANTSDLAKAAVPPSDATPPHGLPVYPGSTVQFCATLEKSGVEWTTADAPADAGTVNKHLRAALLEDGWVAASSPTHGVDAGLPCYERDGATCWVWTIPSEEGLHSITALLYTKAQDQR